MEGILIQSKFPIFFALFNRPPSPPSSSATGISYSLNSAIGSLEGSVAQTDLWKTLFKTDPQPRPESESIEVSKIKP